MREIFKPDRLATNISRNCVLTTDASLELRGAILPQFLNIEAIADRRLLRGLSPNNKTTGRSSLDGLSVENLRRRSRDNS